MNAPIMQATAHAIPGIIAPVPRQGKASTARMPDPKQKNIKLQDLLSLQAGDVITTDKAIERDVLIQVEGRNKFVGQVGQLRGNKSVRITRVCHEPVDAVKVVGPERIGAGSGAGDRR